MQPILPASKPQITLTEIENKIKAKYPEYKRPELLFLGIRGYYKNTMGKTGVNDRMLYDDAIFIVTKSNLFSFNGNTDPSAFKPGIANLKAGIWPVYKFSLHKGQYIALCQRGGEVTVKRDITGDQTGWFGINIHRGGNKATGSLGCQTLPPSQWDEFITEAQNQAQKYFSNWKSKDDYAYILLEE